MALNKLITELIITQEYSPFVKYFKSKIVENFPDRIHSIYICGSIPKGKAIPNTSDADFTLVFKDMLSEKDFDSIEKIKKDVLRIFPFVTKIDTPTCTVNNVLENPYDWGFWISIVSFCLYGEDLSSKLPPMYSNRELVVGINSDTIEVLDNMKRELSDNKFSNNYFRTQKKLAKRLIIALYTLVLPRAQVWTDDLSEMKDSIIKYYTEKKSMINKLYLYSNKLDNNIDNFFIEVNEAQVFFEKEIENLSGARNYCT